MQRTLSDRYRYRQRDERSILGTSRDKRELRGVRWDSMIRIVEELLSRQDPGQPHTLLTRLVVSLCICLAYTVLYGFYGLIAAIAVYLFGVELMGLAMVWMFYPFVAGLLIGGWNALRAIHDYWKNYGHASS